MTAAPSNPWTGKRADLCTVSRAVGRGQGRVSLDLKERADLFHGARAPLEVALGAKRTPDLQHFLLDLLRLGGRPLDEAGELVHELDELLLVRPHLIEVLLERHALLEALLRDHGVSPSPHRG